MRTETGDCRSEEGVIVGLIDGMIAQSRVVARYLRETRPVADSVHEALADLRSDEDATEIFVWRRAF
jgi:hypothetical protein